MAGLLSPSASDNDELSVSEFVPDAPPSDASSEDLDFRCSQSKKTPPKAKKVKEPKAPTKVKKSKAPKSPKRSPKLKLAMADKLARKQDHQRLEDLLAKHKVNAANDDRASALLDGPPSRSASCMSDPDVSLDVQLRLNQPPPQRYWRLIMFFFLCSFCLNVLHYLRRYKQWGVYAVAYMLGDKKYGFNKAACIGAATESLIIPSGHDNENLNFWWLSAADEGAGVGEYHADEHISPAKRGKRASRTSYITGASTRFVLCAVPELSLDYSTGKVTGTISQAAWDSISEKLAAFDMPNKV